MSGLSDLSLDDKDDKYSNFPNNKENISDLPTQDEHFLDVEISFTDAQKRVITTDSIPNSLINIISGPGTGKTTTLCNRILYLLSKGIDPSEIIVFSLTNQSVTDFKNHLISIIGKPLANSIYISTLHSFANKIVKNNSSYWEILRDKKTIDSKILNSILKELSFHKSFSNSSKIKNDLISKLKHSEILKYKIKDPEIYKQYLNYEFHGINSLGLNSIYDKMVFEATQFLNFNKDENIPSFISNFKEIIVDEFQDISAILLDFILILSKDKQLTIAGDIDQSLYVFNGATPDLNINKILNYYKENNYDLKDIVLDETFRFSNDIHKFSLNLLGTNYSLINKVVNENPIHVTRQQFSSPIEEFEFIYNEIKYLIENSNGNLKPKNFAVLSYRNNTLDDFVYFFKQKKSNIKIKRIQSNSKFLETKIATLITFLKILDDPNDDPAMLVTISLLDGMGPKLTMKIKQEAEQSYLSIFDYILESKKYKNINKELFINLNELTNSIDRSDPSSIVMALIEISNAFNFPKQLRTNESNIQFDTFLKELYKYLKKIKSENSDINLLSYVLSNYQSEFLDQSHDDLITYGLEDPNDCIQAMTIHNSKGLEWEIVFVLSTLPCEDSVIPLSINSRTNYVAATRAKNLLYFNKSISCNLINVDTNNPIDLFSNRFKIYYENTMLDYIPKLKNITVPNDLKKLPVYSKPIGITQDKQNLQYLIENVNKRRNIKVINGLINNIKTATKKL